MKKSQIAEMNSQDLISYIQSKKTELFSTYISKAKVDERTSKSHLIKVMRKDVARAYTKLSLLDKQKNC